MRGGSATGCPDRRVAQPSGGWPRSRAFGPALALGLYCTGLCWTGTTAAAPAAPPRPSLGAAVVPVAVFGRDDRIRTPLERAATADKIGVLVDLDRKTVCTAFCVGTSTIVTAAHCVYPASGPQSGTARLGALRFRKTLQDARGEAHVDGAGSRAARQSIAAGSARLSLRPPIDAAHDWAAIRLDRNVCPAGGLALSRRGSEDIHALARERRIYNIAVHRDFADFASAMSAPCDAPRRFDGVGWDSIARDFRDADDLILHTCDTGGSSSGSPLLFDGPDGPEVVGLNVGTYLHSTIATPSRAQQSAAPAPPSPRDIANTAIAAHCFADAVATFLDAEPLTDRESVRRLQAALAGRGHYAGPLDGRPGPRLTTAIRAFEAGADLPLTGRATRGLSRLIGAHGAD